jgi:hypothetical protein
MGCWVKHVRAALAKVTEREERGRTHVDVLSLVFIWTAISIVIVTVSRGIGALATLCRCKERTLCRYGTWLRLLRKDFEFS